MGKYKYKASNPRCGHMMTESQFRAMVKNCLRGLHQTWGGKSQAIVNSRDGSKVVNPATGRECIAHICASCGKKLMTKEVEVDHKDSFVPKGMSWEDMMRRMTLYEIADRMFCEPDGYDILCNLCHKRKTYN